MTTAFALLDAVALLIDIPDQRLQTGQMGTLVEPLAPGVWEVEFSDRDGRTLATCALETRYLLKLTHELAAA
jgi:hypothetical protein